MTKLYRWKCPRCSSGANAPSRPRKDDVRRYCLSCSAETGRLVERIAPALEKQRAVKATKAATKRQTKAQREAASEAARYTVAGVDLRKELKRLCKLKVFKGHFLRNLPELQVRRTKTHPQVFGRAWPWEYRLQVTDYPGIDEADIKETLCHELVHLFVGGDQSDHRWHGVKFQQVMREAFREAYGVTPRGAADNRYHGRYARGLRESAQP